MMIRSLKISNFKIHESLVLEDLNTDVQVFGENFRGKSSIAEAILFCLEGVTVTGSNRVDDLVRKGAKEAVVGVNLSVEGKDIEVIRKKGLTGAAKIYIDRQKAKQEDIDVFLGTKEHFMSVFMPGYFTSMTNDKARELIMTIIKPPLREDVLKAIGISAKKIDDLQLLDPNDDLKETREALKRNREQYQRTLGQIEAHDEKLSIQVSEERIFDSSELDNLLKIRKDSNAGILVQINHLKEELASIRPDYNKRKAELKEIPEAPYKENDPCPVCAQTLNQDALVHALKHHEKEVLNIKNANANILHDLKHFIDKGKELSSKIADLEKQADPDSAAKLNEKIRVLEEAKELTISHNMRVRTLKEDKQKAQQKIDELKKQLDSLDADESEMNEVIKALGEYRAKYAELQLAQLKAHLVHANVELFTIVKSTGELKPAFTVTYDDKPFNMLSTSERIRCNLEFATMINKITERDYPVYIDNAETITHYERPQATQVFTATVVKDTDLTVK